MTLPGQSFPAPVVFQQRGASHEERIVRIRVELEYERQNTRDSQFVAKGHVEIYGPNLNCAVASDDCLKSLDLLVDKLDRMLRRRTTALHVARVADDIRNHAD